MIEICFHTLCACALSFILIPFFCHKTVAEAESDEQSEYFGLKNNNPFVATWPSLSLLETHLVICTLEGNGKPFGTFVH